MPPQPESEQPARHVAVTGASRGLGRAIACAFAQPGARIGVHYAHDAAAAAETAQQIRARGAAAYTIHADFSCDDDTCRAAAAISAQQPRLDALVLNAGIAPVLRLAELDPQTWNRVLTVNYRAPVLLTRLLAPAALGAGGHVVMIGSLVGLRGEKGLAAYAAAKGALLGFVRDAAREFGGRRIAVNAVVPGLLPTAMTAHLGEERFARLAGENALGAGTTVAQVAAFIVALTAMPHVSGQVFFLDSRLWPDSGDRGA